MKTIACPQKPLVVALRAQVRLPVAVGVSAAIALTGSHLAAAFPTDEPFRERPGQDQSASHRELMFVDPAVADPEQLLIALRPNVETIVLERDREGLEQIAEVLAQRRDVKAIHIVAHGEAGSLSLAGAPLTAAALNEASALLDGWFGDRPDRPDILLYTCDLASGPEGLAFVERLGSLTGADVAASTNLTGQNGDWKLEYHFGAITTANAFREELVNGWAHNLATFTVTNTNDSGAGSLRQAVLDSNAAAGADVIVFDAGVTGTITLTTGQLLVTDDLTITGPGASSLAVSGNNASRVIQVYATTDATNVNNDFFLEDITIRDGNGTGGGSLFGGGVHIGGDFGDGTVAILRSQIVDNTADYGGGGVFIELDGSGSISIYDTTIDGNTAVNWAGGLYMANAADATVSASIITNNSSGSGGGGLTIFSIDEAIIDSTDISDNAVSTENGGGIWVGLDTSAGSVEFETLKITDSIISDNSAGSNGGGIEVYFDDGDNAYEAVVIERTLISGNTAVNYGGGIRVYSDDAASLVTIRSSVIRENSALEGGGISFYADDDGSLHVIDSTISYNTATDDGGGIAFYSDDGYLAVIQSTISHNSAGDTGSGGGIHIETSDDPVLIQSSTIVFNDAGANGGGIYAEDDSNAVYILNSIIAENATGAADGVDIFVAPAETFTADYSLIGSYNRPPVTSGGMIVGLASGVNETLRDLGGVTLVHPLEAGSPAINSAQTGFTQFASDQRGAGFDRVNQGRLDMGAFETNDSDGDGVPLWQEEESPVVPVPTLSGYLLGLLAALLGLLGGRAGRSGRRQQ